MIRLGTHPAVRSKNPVELPLACKEMDEVGWDGFEFGAGAAARADNFAEAFADTELVVSGPYSPAGWVDDEKWPEEWENLQRNADACVKYDCVLMFDGGTRRPEGPSEDDIKKVADRVNEAGRMAKEKGVQATWHQHWGRMFELEPNMRRLLELTDPDLLHFTPDTAQMALGWFDIEGFFKEFADRMTYVHFKDLDRNRRFIELGRGIVDFPTCFKIMQEAAFDAWIVVDLDYTSLSPRESFQANLDYLTDTLGISTARSQQGS